MKRYLIILTIAAAVFLGCGNGSYSINNSDEHPAQPGLDKIVNCIDATLLKVWNSSTQSQKDLKLLSVGIYDVGKNVGVQCKPWIKNVVLTASGITLPNAASNIYWSSTDPCGNPCLNVNIINKGSIPLISMSSMDIIQMYWRPRLKGGVYGSPEQHTAFVIGYIHATYDRTGKAISIDSTKWLDCNYVGTDQVGIHSVPCDSFVKWTGPKSGGSGTGYTVYHVAP